MNAWYRIAKIAIATFLVTALIACSSPMSPLPASKPAISIGSPPHGAQIILGQDVLIQANAADPNGIARIELWVNGMLVNTAQPSTLSSSFSAVLHWTPTALGAQTVMVKAVNPAGVTSDPSAVAVNVVNANPPTIPPPTLPPPPSASVAPSPQSSSSAASSSASSSATSSFCVNDAVFVEHVTVPDGTNWTANQTFNKIWRVRNTGNCPWSSGYEFIFVGGEAMTSLNVAPVPYTAPGTTADLLVAMTAPASPGTHSGQWRIANSPSGPFGSTMNVSINVLGAAQQPIPPGCAGAPVIGDFIANPGTISAGQQSVLSWGPVTNANSAVIDNGIGGIATPGSTTVRPNQNTTYTLTAAGCGGTVTKQVSVQVTGGGGAASSASSASSASFGSIFTILPLLPRGDANIEDVFLSTGNEVILRIGVTPTGSLTGNITYQVYANGTLVKQASIALPTGSQAFWTGYVVNGTQTIKAVINVTDLNAGNNTKTVSCNSASHSCQ